MMQSAFEIEQKHLRQISVLVVDDHLLLAETIASSLKLTSEFAVWIAKDVASARTAVVESGPFDVILLDYALPGVEGVVAMREMIAANGRGVALFSGVARWPVVERALAAGAMGFIPKTMSLSRLANAIRLISGGDIYLPTEYVQQVTQEQNDDRPLKPREKKVLEFLCEGLQNKEIASKLGVSVMTVKMDLRAICRKLGARNRTEAAMIAQRDELC